MTESFAELFEQSLANQRIRPGMILTGLVVDVTPDVVVVNVGLKSEAVIPVEQFKNERGEIEVKTGDQVEVALDSVEDGTGETRLSREKAKRARTWTRLEEAFNKSEIVTGVITGRVKGGFTVEIENVRAFLPGSLVDVRPVRDTSYLEGKPLEFKVIKLDQKRNNVVVSRRAVVEQEFSAERSALLENLQEGSVVHGAVKNLTDYGAFVDLGGIDGLLHITDMAWKRVKHPSEVVKVGDEIDVRILKFDRERSRVSLGLKQLGADPWENIARRYPPHTRVFGKVTNIADYGAFVEIEDGVEGLVHVSEMDWTNKNVNPAKVVHTGQEVEVMVLDVDEDRRRISLGLKQCKANPWKEFAENYNRGDKVAGQIKSITDFGIFIGLHRQHRRPGAPVRHLLGSARGRGGAQLPEGPAGRGHGAHHRSGARAHQPRHPAARQGPLLELHRGKPQGHDRQGRGQGRGCPRRDHRPRQRCRGSVARLGAGPRPHRGCAQRAQGRRRGRGEVHRCRPQVARHHPLDQGEGGARGGGGGAELSLLRGGDHGHEPGRPAEGAHRGSQLTSTPHAIRARAGPSNMTNMTKSELIEIITAKQKHLPAKDVELALKQILEIMSDSLSSGDRIEIRGFGSFCLHFRPPRQGRNPKTGEAVALSGKYVPHFKPGKDLRERVNDGADNPIRD